MINFEEYLFASQDFFNPIDNETESLSFEYDTNMYNDSRTKGQLQNNHLTTPTELMYDTNNSNIMLDLNINESPVTLPSSINENSLSTQISFTGSDDSNCSTASVSSFNSSNKLEIFDYEQLRNITPFSSNDVANQENNNSNYVKQPRQSRYNTTKDIFRYPTKKNKGIKERSSLEKENNNSCEIKTNRHKKVSDSRLSAHGLAEVLHLESPEEALERERNILDIFENELHYPLGYKTWVRDTKKEYRAKLIGELYARVNSKYPHYNYNVSILETIIRRATYYMMQSRLRRERRAKTKEGKDRRNNELV